MDVPTPVFFSDQKEFRNWLEVNHTTKTEIWVGFYKVNSARPNMTWSQSVDEALCFGWIDGIRKSVDDESYCIRFTPRKPNSVWSKININKVGELRKKGLMTQAGLAVYEIRNRSKSAGDGNNDDSLSLNEEFERLFKANKNAWEYFENQSQSYRRLIIKWIMSGKQEKTQLSRLHKTIKASGKHTRIF